MKQQNLSPTPSETCSGSEELTCNYDTNPTKLYQLLEASDWDAVVAHCQTDPTEARTWIIRYKKETNKVRWRLLPLHSAIMFASPSFVVSALLKTYPAAASKRDDQGMIALHLAFHNYEYDEITLKELLRTYPEGVNAKDFRGRLPIDLGRNERGVYSAKLMRLYSAAFTIATQNRKKEEKKSVSLKFERASSPNPAQEDLDQVVSTMKTAHAKEIANVKSFYEERIQTMVAQTMKSLAKLQINAEEANRDLRDQHYRDMFKMRELLSLMQKEKDTGDSPERLQKEIDDLKLALQRARSEQGTDAQNENLNWQMTNLQKDHETLQVLIRAQQVELATAKEIRAAMLQNLMAQDKEDHAMAMQDGERLATLAENIRVRMEHLPFGAPLGKTMIANESSGHLPSGTAPKVRDTTTIANESSVEDGEDDTISSLTDQASL